MTGESSLRRIEDIDGAALTYAEVKAIASGNPLVIEKASIDAEVARLTRLQSQHRESRFRMHSEIRHLSEDLPRLEKRLESIRQDLEARQDTSGERFVIELDGQEIRNRGTAGELILRHADRLRGSGGEVSVGNFAGFRVLVADSGLRGPEIVLKGATTHIAKVRNTAHGTMQSVEYTLRSLDEAANDFAQSIVDTQKRLTGLGEQVGEAFEYGDRLAGLITRQQEITEALDLTKNQAPSNLAAEASQDTLAATGESEPSP